MERTSRDEGPTADRESPDGGPGRGHESGFRLTLRDRLARLPRQLRRATPFGGTIEPRRIPLLAPGSRRPSLPFPHPWNYREPLLILETFFHGADADRGAMRHNRYLEVPWFSPVLVTRDPGVIRAISAETGDRDGQFDRDTMPSVGIARATGKDTLLYANGPMWKRQKKLATPPFARTTLFQPEQFRGFAEVFRTTVGERLEALRQRIACEGEPVRLELEPEIKAIMLELLVNCFFGAEVPTAEVRSRYVPAIDCVIENIVRDSVVNRLGIPMHALPPLTTRMARIRDARADFERLTDLVIERRRHGCGLWRQFRSDAPDSALRSNVRVFLAGALEATTSYASWAIAHLARDPEVQEELYREVATLDDYTPEVLDGAVCLRRVLDETLRLTPSLYFHPRLASADTVVATSSGQTLHIPRGTHILLDVWHANRHEDHWGIEVTGAAADRFAPSRWLAVASEDRNAKDLLHFGFGHGPRFCPGKSLGQLEVALVVGACVKLFRFTAVHEPNPPRAGVSTKPRDGVLVDLRLRSLRADPAPGGSASEMRPTAAGGRCPFAAPDGE